MTAPTPRSDASLAILLDQIAAFTKGTIYADDLKVALKQEFCHIRKLETDLAAHREALKEADGAIKGLLDAILTGEASRIDAEGNACSAIREARTALDRIQLTKEETKK